MIELESSPRSKQRNSHDNSLLDGQQEMPRNNSTKPSSGRYKNTPKSRMDSLLCGGGGWKVPAFQDAVECMGLGPIFDTGSPWIRRTFWFIVVCLGWVLAVYQIAEQIQVYFGWPVSSMVDIRYFSNNINFESTVQKRVYKNVYKVPIYIQTQQAPSIPCSIIDKRN